MQESVVSVLRYIAQDNILRQSFYYGYRPTHLEGPTYGILGKGALSDTICVKSLHFSIITINGDILALVHVSGVNVDSGLEIEQDIWPNRKATEEDLKIISTIASPLKIEVLRYNRANTQLCFYTWTKYEQNDAFHELSGDVITYNDELYYCTTSKHEPRNIMIVDTETDYTSVDLDTSYKSIDKWPIIKQIAWTIYDKNGHPLFSKNFYLDDSFQVSDDFTSIYPFSRKPKHTAIKEFTYDLENCDIIVGHNIKYDVQVILSELYRLGLSTDYLANIKQFCTMKNSIDICGFETEWGNRFPKLQELYSKLFHRPFSNAHDAYYDVKATADCFWELIELNNNEQGNGFYDLYLELIPENKREYYSQLYEQLAEGIYFGKGYNREKYENALSLYEKAGLLGNPNGFFMSGMICEYYLDNCENAKEFFRKAVEKKHLRAYTLLYPLVDSIEKEQLFNEWSNIGDKQFDNLSIDDMVLYICTYRDGIHGEHKDLIKAVQLCQRALKLGRDIDDTYFGIVKQFKGLPQYVNELSVLIELLGTKYSSVDKTKITKDNRTAYLEDLCELAECYYYGKGTSVDYTAAKKIIETILQWDDGNPVAYYLYGQYHENGLIDMPVNYHDAFKAYSKVAYYPKAARQLGYLYLNGYGCEKNKRAAKKLLTYADQNGVDVGNLLTKAKRWF